MYCARGPTPRLVRKIPLLVRYAIPRTVAETKVTCSHVGALIMVLRNAPAARISIDAGQMAKAVAYRSMLCVISRTFRPYWDSLGYCAAAEASWRARALNAPSMGS